MPPFVAQFVTLLPAIAEEKRRIFEILALAPAWADAAELAQVLAAIETCGVTDRSIPFVYFQF